MRTITWSIISTQPFRGTTFLGCTRRCATIWWHAGLRLSARISRLCASSCRRACAEVRWGNPTPVVDAAMTSVNDLLQANMETAPAPWVLETVRISVAFAQVREDAALDQWVVDRLPDA